MSDAQLTSTRPMHTASVAVGLPWRVLSMYRDIDACGLRTQEIAKRRNNQWGADCHNPEARGQRRTVHLQYPLSVGTYQRKYVELMRNARSWSGSPAGWGNVYTTW